MRKGNKPNFLKNKKGEFLGVNMSSDFCSEHEWGIKGIKRDFHVEESTGYGVDRRIIRHTPPETLTQWGYCLRFFKAGANWCLGYSSGEQLTDIESKGSSSELRLKDKGPFVSEADTIAAAWDERTFGILVRPEDKSKLEALYEAFKKKDVVITFAGGFFIENPGLCLLIGSKVDEETKARLTEVDKDHERLLKAAKETTIEKFLKKSGKEWFALSPRWINADLKKRSKYKVMYWLTPMRQQVDHAGMFTVEDLQAWAEGKGPVPLTKATNL